MSKSIPLNQISPWLAIPMAKAMASADMMKSIPAIVVLSLLKLVVKRLVNLARQPTSCILSQNPGQPTFSNDFLMNDEALISFILDGSNLETGPPLIVLLLLTVHGVCLHDRNPSLIGRKERVEFGKQGKMGQQV